MKIFGYLCLAFIAALGIGAWLAGRESAKRDNRDFPYDA